MDGPGAVFIKSRIKEYCQALRALNLIAAGAANCAAAFSAPGVANRY